MNRDEGQYQLNHIFDEFLVPTGLKSPIGQQTGNPIVAKNSNVARRQHQSHLVLRKMVVSIKMYTVSGILI